MATPSWAGERVSPEHVRRAAGVLTQTLAPLADRDWSVPAGPLTWTCRETLDHVSDALGFYCGQLAARRTEGKPRFRNGDPNASIENLILAVETGAAMLGAIADGSPEDARAWHRMGVADAEGFLAMGCEEILIHTWDIGQGFGLDVVVPENLAAAVLGRLFPWAPVSCSAWEAQLWCSDRISLAEVGRIGKWGWHGAPIAEWDGAERPARVFG
jgi:hypothetical protein